MTLNATWNVPADTTNLCLNGHTIHANCEENSFSVITIPANAALNLYDCNTTTKHYYTLTVTELAETAPAANEGFTLDYAAETLIAENGYEVSSTNGDTAAALTDDQVESGNTEKTYYVRKTASDNNHADSDWTAITVPARPATPNTSIASTTAGSITVTAVNGAEYRLDDGEWQDSNVFTGLEAAGNHTVYVRIKAVADTDFASEAQTILNVYTNAGTPAADDGYTIDYADEKITVTEGYEISRTDAPAFSAESLTDGGMTVEPGTTYYIRKAAVSGGASASETVSFTAPARPATITVWRRSSRSSPSVRPAASRTVPTVSATVTSSFTAASSPPMPSAMRRKPPPAAAAAAARAMRSPAPTRKTAG